MHLAFRCGAGESQSRVIGTLQRKPAAQSQTTPEEPSHGELEGPFTLVRRGKSLSRLAEPYILQRRGRLPRCLVGQSESRRQQFVENVTELENVWNTGAITRRADAQSWLSQLPWGTVFVVT